MSEKVDGKVDALLAAARAAYPVCSSCGEDLVPRDGELCGACVKPEIAAAEERGRRAGIEEAAKCPDCGGALESFCSSDKCRDAAIKAWSLAPRKSAPAVAAHAFEPCHKGFDICAHRNRPDEFPCNRPRRDHAPRDSGTSCGADEDGIHREARRDRK